MSLTVLLPYLFLVVISTVVARRVGNEYRFVLKPFWTIQTILSGGKSKAWLIKEVILNILMLMPVGLLAPMLFERREKTKTLFLGIGISLSIEILQFVMHRGLAETDDIMSNTLGVLIGIGIYCSMKFVISCFVKR